MEEALSSRLRAAIFLQASCSGHLRPASASAQPRQGENSLLLPPVWARTAPSSFSLVFC